MLTTYDIFFGIWPAIKTIIRLGFMPKEEDFKELTPHQYEKFYNTVGYTEEKIYALLPDDPQRKVPLESAELMVLKEQEKEYFEQGWVVIEQYCFKSGRKFLTEKEKIAYAASCLPYVFSKGSEFEHYHNSQMHVVR